MNLCCKCHERVAVVFIARMDGDGKPKNEGYCLKCAKEMGIKPVDDMIKQMGISEEQFDEMSDLIDDTTSEMFSDENGLVPEEEGGNEEETDNNNPSFNIGQIFNTAREHFKTNQKNKERKKKSFLEDYCLDLTRQASEGKLDNIIGREKELQRVIQILCRRQKNNPCLIGEPGVGKTAIAEALAQKIAEGEVPYKLKDKEIQLLDLTALVAGTQFRGQFEARMKKLIEEVRLRGNVILVIDEVHNIVGAGDAEGSMNAGNILKPALSRGQVQVIGATTLTEYRKYIEKDTALERRFQPIIVDEPSIEDTVAILSGVKKYYESFHGIKIPENVIRNTVLLSERYITDRYLPDKAIDILDEAASALALSVPAIGQASETSSELDTVKSEIEKIETKLTSENDEEKREAMYKQVADLRIEEIELETKLKSLREEIAGVALSIDDVAKVIETWTGVPASNITEREFLRVSKLDERLKKRIVGQDKAVDSVVRAIKRSRAGVKYKRKPVSFIFAGPTGVGKTELVKTLAADLFDSPESLIRLDMSEFMEKYSVSKIIGSPPGYVGYDDAGQLTEKIRRKPYSVILFDEIEKAHPDVLNILLQVLDDGRITDSQGRTVNFENTIIVMTTNAGSTGVENTMGFGRDSQELSEDKTQKALLGFLRPEFINRVDEVITFRALSREDFSSIVSIMLNDLSGALSSRGVTLTWDKKAEEYIAEKSFSTKYGARNMRRFIETNVEDVIASKFIDNYEDNYNKVNITEKDGNLDFSFEKTV